jgi:assimilatory nitrate reductase catalytic subunit
VRAELRALMARFPFASCVPFADGSTLAEAGPQQASGVLFRAAGHEPAPDELLQQLESLLGLADGESLRYADRRKGQRRAIRLRRDGADTLLQGLLLAGDTSAGAWIKVLLQQQLPAQAYGRALLAPGAKPAAAIVAAGRQVCSCFGVAAPAIEAQLAGCHGSGEERLAALQGALKCGTNCGSCLPELKRMVRGHAVAAGGMTPGPH